MDNSACITYSAMRLYQFRVVNLRIVSVDLCYQCVHVCMYVHECACLCMCACVCVCLHVCIWMVLMKHIWFDMEYVELCGVVCVSNGACCAACRNKHFLLSPYVLHCCVFQPTTHPMWTIILSGVHDPKMHMCNYTYTYIHMSINQYSIEHQNRKQPTHSYVHCWIDCA